MYLAGEGNKRENFHTPLGFLPSPIEAEIYSSPAAIFDIIFILFSKYAVVQVYTQLHNRRVRQNIKKKTD